MHHKCTADQNLHVPAEYLEVNSCVSLAPTSRPECEGHRGGCRIASLAHSDFHRCCCLPASMWGVSSLSFCSCGDAILNEKASHFIYSGGGRKSPRTFFPSRYYAFKSLPQRLRDFSPIVALTVFIYICCLARGPRFPYLF